MYLIFKFAYLWIFYEHNWIFFYIIRLNKCATMWPNLFLYKTFYLYYLKLMLEARFTGTFVLVYFYIFPLSNCDPKQYVSSHIMRPITTLPSWFWKTLKADRNAASGQAEVIRPRCFVLSEPQMVLEVMKRFMVSYRLVGVEGGVILWSVGENTGTQRMTGKHGLLEASFLLKHFII